ncbi:hypothetical protein BURMUCGD1_5326 [Burkholderia multivorans CGD1]|nr:hypothetical protein BURMUCGD1_5326 [Burkholderia multivorans CGD1]
MQKKRPTAAASFDARPSALQRRSGPAAEDAPRVYTPHITCRP